MSLGVMSKADTTDTENKRGCNSKEKMATNTITAQHSDPGKGLVAFEH